MNDDIARDMYIAQDEIRRTARIEREKSIQREHKPLNLTDLLKSVLILFLLILLGLRGFKVDLKGVFDLFKYFK